LTRVLLAPEGKLRRWVALSDVARPTGRSALILEQGLSIAYAAADRAHDGASMATQLKEKQNN
jgi:hypothetical protein